MTREVSIGQTAEEVLAREVSQLRKDLDDLRSTALVRASATGTASTPPTADAASAVIATSETTTSTTYTDLATVGPAVTLTVPPSGKVLVTVSCAVRNSGGSDAFMSVDVTGTPADDTRAARSSTSGFIVSSVSMLRTGLTPGASLTFTAKYRTGAATTGTFAYRRLIAIPL